MKAFLGGFMIAGLLASSALAQSTGGTWNDLPDQFQVDTGYFRVNAHTILRFNGRQGSGDVDFEKDLGISPNASTFWIEGTRRLGRRHEVKLAYTRLNRDQPSHTLQRDFVWGGQTYNAGLTANSTNGFDILGGYYRFALIRNDRFEFGPTAGFGYLWLRAGIQATGTVTGPDGTLVNRTLDESASVGSITGALGGYANAWPAKRLVFRGDYLYIKVSPGNTTASIQDWRVGGDFYFFRNAGLGAQYKYNKYSYDRGILVTKLGGEVTYKGFQVFLSFLF